jgi:ATP-dependent Clp protease ATP-binding subunit ClpC
MFDNYTEKAKRVIFFARYEAGDLGANTINAEHLFLGLIREAGVSISEILFKNELNVKIMLDEFRKELFIGKKHSGYFDMPLSNDSKIVLAYSDDESAKLSHKHIGWEHLLLGLLRTDKEPLATYLKTKGMYYDEIKRKLSEG